MLKKGAGAEPGLIKEGIRGIKNLGIKVYVLDSNENINENINEIIREL